MFTYTIAEIARLGEADPKYGQGWWGKTVEDLKPIKFNVMQGEFKPGDTISCEESLNKRSNKGVDYLQLKKVRLVGETPPQTPVVAQAAVQVAAGGDETFELLKEVNRKIDILLGNDERFSAERGGSTQSTAWEKAGEILKQQPLPVDDSFGDEDAPDYS